MSFNQVVYSILLTILTAIVPILVTYLCGIAKNYITNLVAQKSDVEAETLKKYIDIAINAIETGCLETTQTYVDAMKKAGTFNEESQKIAREKTLARAKELMGNAVYTLLSQSIGDMDAFITSHFEAYIKSCK